MISNADDFLHTTDIPADNGWKSISQMAVTLPVARRMRVMRPFLPMHHSRTRCFRTICHLPLLRLIHRSVNDERPSWAVAADPDEQPHTNESSLVSRQISVLGDH
jgi:hypothetical protein